MSFDECLKHEFQQEYGKLLTMSMSCRALAKSLPSWMQSTILFIQGSTAICWNGYLSSACTCFDAATTMRLGASWAGKSVASLSMTITLHRRVSDVADLDDFSD